MAISHSDGLRRDQWCHRIGDDSGGRKVTVATRRKGNSLASEPGFVVDARVVRPTRQGRACVVDATVRCSADTPAHACCRGARPVARHPAGLAPVQLGRECGAGREERDPQRQGEIRWVRKPRGRAFRHTTAQQRTPPKGTRSFGSLFRRVVRKDAASGPERLTRSGITVGMTVAGRRKDTAVRDWVDACTGGRRSPSADAGAVWPSPGWSSASPSAGLPLGCGGRR